MKRLATILLLSFILTSCNEALPTQRIDYGNVPDFSLTDSSGRTVTLKDLQGKIWVADFIFTSCAGTCPVMSGRLRTLQDSLPEEVLLVSFTVDPARDTPEVLAAHAKSLGAKPGRWFFLTGDRQALYDLSIKGFKLALDDSQGSAAEPITHSSRLVLVDRTGLIVGYFGGTDETEFQKLIGVVRKMLV